MLSHDRSQLRTIPGLRNAIGAILPLVAGLLLGNVLAGLAVTVGAQVAGFAGLNGTARKRLRTMLFAAFWMGITTFIGGVTGGSWLAVVSILILGFLAGLLICVSNEAGMVGTWATIALIFISGTHQNPHSAMVRALLVVSGGLLQTLLMVLFDWLSTSNTETKSVIKVYLSIARYARSPSRSTDLNVASALLDADANLRDSFMNTKRKQRLVQLLNFAELLRIEVVALTGMIRSFQTDAGVAQEEARTFKDACHHIANSLEWLGNAIGHPGCPLPNPLVGIQPLQQIRHMSNRPELQSASSCIERIYHELAAAAGALLHPNEAERTKAHVESRSTFSQLQSNWQSLRTNFTFQSAAFRHAVRLAILLTAATLLSHISPLPRGYWLPLTTLVILKPEFSTTFSRGIARVFGTLIGAVFATGLISIPDKTHVFGIVLVGLLLWGMYTVLSFNMVLFSTILTGEVVILLSFFQMVPPETTILDRVVYTVAGSLLAFLAYLVWPTWQHRNVPAALRKVIAEQRGYLQSVLLGSRDGADRIITHRKRTRLARTNAVNMITQATAEPVMGALDKHNVEGLLTSIHRFSDHILSLEFHLRDADGDYIRKNEKVIQFGKYAARCLAEIEQELEQPNTMGRRTSAQALAEGALDEVSPVTKQELLEMEVPSAAKLIFVRMENALSTMFRMVPLTMRRDGNDEDDTE